MFKQNNNSNVLAKNRLGESSNKVLEAKNLHTTSIVLRNKLGIKSEIEATSNSPISCPKRKFLAIFLRVFFYLKIKDDSR